MEYVSHAIPRRRVYGLTASPAEYMSIAAAHASAANIFELIEDVRWWVQTELPELNAAIEIGGAPVELLIRQTSNWVCAIQDNRSVLFADMEPIKALQLLQIFGFLVSSIERHTKGFGFKPGEGINRVPGLEGLLLSLGAVAGHAPRDSHDTYWRMNSGPIVLTFTRNAGETFFNGVVNETQFTLSEVSASVQCIRAAGEKNFDTATSILSHAVRRVTGLHARYRGYMLKNEQTGERNMTPEFFMYVLRQYLGPYPVGGILREGPNATNTTGWPQLDFLVGTFDVLYKETVEGRFRWMLEIDQDLLRTDMQTPSLADRMLEYLELSPAKLESLTQGQIRHAVVDKGPAFVSLFHAYQELANAALRLSDIHVSLIKNYLVRPSKNADPAALEKCPVKPVTGVGGNNLDHTFKIVEMRRNHPIVRRLATA